MSLREFATKHRLTVRKDIDATEIIPGKHGQIYEYAPDELGVLFMPTGEPRPRLWSSVRAKCIAAGMTLRQNGDAEGALSFDPESREQARLAIKVAGIRAKRQATASQLANLAKGNATRFESARRETGVSAV